MKYSLQEILKITACELLNEDTQEAEITDIFFDTRRGIYGPNALFLAIDGKNADGHQYISQAYEKLNTRNFLVSQRMDPADFPGANFIYSRNVIHSLQQLASHHRSKYSPIVIGITGSNGKTIVKEWLFQLLSPQLNIVRSPGSYNSQLGVPLSVLKMGEGHELAIIEAGISTSGSMEQLAYVVRPEVGIFTNIGEAHSAGFPSMEAKAREKAVLFTKCEKVVYCRDHDLIHEVLQGTNSQLISWSAKGSDATYHVTYDDHSITTKGNSFTIPFKDEISRENATHAIVTALELGFKNLKTETLSTIKMRLEMKHGINNTFLINDSYTSDYNALASALKILEQQQKKQRNTLILSQIEETSLAPADDLERIKNLIESHDIQQLITVGERLMDIDFNGDYHKYPTTESLLKDLPYLRLGNENILIKGARKFNLEQVFNKLSVKVHQTILEIDLEAMRHNLMVFRSLLESETKLMVVLKAAAYGSGSLELSRFLSYQRVDYIAVAYVDEGIELRKSGIELPIMVMNPEESGFESMVEYRLEPELYSIAQLRSFLNYVQDDGFPVHLKIETGMHRLGIEEGEVEELGQCLLGESRLRVASIFSHLVGSDDPDLDAFSRKQVSRFLSAYERISAILGYKPDKHVLNSNGISRFPEYHFEMVRLGIGLHGLSDDPGLSGRLQKVQTLKTRISQIKTLEHGESVGYSRNFVAGGVMAIGTINIGYADGLPRNAGNGRYQVLVNGKDGCPTIGNVCMDMCMIDVTEVDVREGDEVEIFSERWPIEKLAEACDTIPYEILTRLAGRIHRVFLRE